MVEVEFFTKDAYGKNLYGKCWTPENDPTVVIALIHGLGDHIGRFNQFASSLVSKNMAIIGLDYQGHGQSPGKRGHVRSYQLLMSNIEELLKEARVRFNEIPLFLYGHSLGGNQVANYALQHQSKELSGLILSAPFFKLSFDPPGSKIQLAKFMGKLLPSLTVDNELDPMELSHDPIIGKNYLEDPLVHGKVSLNLYNISSDAGANALAKAHLLRYPTLIMHGDEDRLTSKKASEQFAKSAKKYATFKLWKGMRHELHNEIQKKEVIQFIYNWIIKTIEKRDVQAQ